MKLYHDPISTSSRIVTFCLHDQDISFEDRQISVHAGEQFEPEFAALNPNSEVPVLVDGDFVLTQSGAILKYVAAKHGLDIYPAGLRQRARVDEDMSWFATNFHVFHCAMLSYTYIMPQLAGLDPAVLATVRAIGGQGSRKYLGVLNDHMLASTEFVRSDRITLADYVGAANVTLGDAAGIDFEEYPNVIRWLSTLRARKGWRPAFGTFEAMIAAKRPAPSQAA